VRLAQGSTHLFHVFLMPFNAGQCPGAAGNLYKNVRHSTYCASDVRALGGIVRAPARHATTRLPKSNTVSTVKVAGPCPAVTSEKSAISVWQVEPAAPVRSACETQSFTIHPVAVGRGQGNGRSR
jgi:hypothetical protein